jgi:hypothetical protein
VIVPTLGRARAKNLINARRVTQKKVWIVPFQLDSRSRASITNGWLIKVLLSMDSRRAYVSIKRWFPYQVGGIPKKIEFGNDVSAYAGELHECLDH